MVRITYYYSFCDNKIILVNVYDYRYYYNYNFCDNKIISVNVNDSPIILLQ